MNAYRSLLVPVPFDAPRLPTRVYSGSGLIIAHAVDDSRGGPVFTVTPDTFLNLYGSAFATVADESSQSRAAISTAPLNCSILFTDIVGFGDVRRDDEDRRMLRGALYRILREALEASDVPWAACRHEDRGDGTLTVVPPDVPTMSLVDPLLAQLAAKLRRYNRQADGPVRLQLRAALHVGPVFPDRHGLYGQALIHAARMLDASILKESLAATGAELGFMASAHVYDTVVRHASGLVDPGTFRRVQFRIKESEITGWMHLASTTGKLCHCQKTLCC